LASFSTSVGSSGPRLKTQQDNGLWNKLVERRWSPYVLCTFSKVQSTHPWEP